MSYIGLISVVISFISAIFIFFPFLRLASLILSILGLILGLLGIYYKTKKKEFKLLELVGTAVSFVTIILYIVFLFI